MEARAHLACRSFPAQSAVPTPGTWSGNSRQVNAGSIIPEWQGTLKFLPCFVSGAGSWRMVRGDSFSARVASHEGVHAWLDAAGQM